MRNTISDNLLVILDLLYGVCAQRYNNPLFFIAFKLNLFMDENALFVLFAP